FNPTTTIRFSTPSACKVRLTVYNLYGEVVRTLVNGEMAAGDHLATFDGSDLASGVYFCRLEAGELIATQKMILAK
ncbi:MAG: T9SS type A sorting domain-containing protein, partial [bacterium]